MQGIFESRQLNIEAFCSSDLSKWNPMFHPHAEIIYVAAGSLRCTVDGCFRTLAAGEAEFTFPYSIHSIEAAPAGTKLFVVLFMPSAAGSFEKELLELLSKKPVCPFIVGAETAAPLMARMCELSRHGGREEFLPTIQGYLTAVVGELLHMLSLVSIEKADMDVMRHIFAYCTEHYMEDISVESIARSIHVSHRYITKVFSAKLGCSFRNYINNLRIQRAMELLKTTDKRVIDIMLDCGFENQSTFNKVFRDVCGVSPRFYRRK